MTGILFVGVGGFLGAVARYLVAARLTMWLSRVTGWEVPFGTAFVNITGSFLLGFFMEWARVRLPANSDMILLVGTGFFGAYTTYSTFANENIVLLRQGEIMTALGYVALTTVFCLVAAWLGVRLAS